MGDTPDKIFSRFLHLHGRDNFTEKIVHTFTIWILLFFMILLTSKMVFGDLINCQAQPEDPSSWVDYLHDYCFYQDKYRVNRSTNKYITETRVSGNGKGFSLVVEKENDVYEQETVTYYQWIPYILMCQVFMCLTPALLWKFVGLRCFRGNDFDAILRSFISKMPGTEGMETVRNFDKETMKRTATYIHRLLRQKKTDRFGMHSTMIIYVLMKWVSCISLISQFWLMAAMYSNGAFLWGVHMTYNLIHDEDYNDLSSGAFPRIVKCDVLRLTMGHNIHRRSFYCLLTQNFINEKVFLFLYWWYVFTIIVSFCSAVRFTILLIYPKYQRYTTKSLIPTQEYFFEMSGEWARSFTAMENDSLEYFVDYLGCDGYLLLQLISDMVHLMPVRQLSTELWNRIVVQNNYSDEEEEDDDDDEETMLNATAPPIDQEDGKRQQKRNLAGKEKGKNKKNKNFKKNLKEVQQRLADKALAEEAEFDKKPLLSNSQSPSSSKEDFPRYVPGPLHDEVFHNIDNDSDDEVPKVRHL